MCKGSIKICTQKAKVKGSEGAECPGYTPASQQTDLQPLSLCALTTDSLLKRILDWLQQGLPASKVPTPRSSSLETIHPTDIRAAMPRKMGAHGTWEKKQHRSSKTERFS